MPNTSLSSLPLPKEWLSHPDGMRFVRAFHLVEREDAARIAFLYGATKLKELLSKHRLPSTMDSVKLVVEADGRKARKARRKLEEARAGAIRENNSAGAGRPPSGKAGEATNSRWGRIKNSNGLHTKPSSAWRAGNSYEDPYSIFDDDETEVYPHWWPKSPPAKTRGRGGSDDDDDFEHEKKDNNEDGAKDAVPVLAADTEWPIEMNAYAVPRRKDGHQRHQVQQQQEHRGEAVKPRISAAVRGGRVFDADRRAREREAIAARRGDRASTASSRAKARVKFAGQRKGRSGGRGGRQQRSQAQGNPGIPRYLRGVRSKIADDVRRQRALVRAAKQAEAGTARAAVERLRRERLGVGSATGARLPASAVPGAGTDALLVAEAFGSGPLIDSFADDCGFRGGGNGTGGTFLALVCLLSCLLANFSSRLVSLVGCRNETNQTQPPPFLFLDQ